MRARTLNDPECAALACALGCTLATLMAACGLAPTGGEESGSSTSTSTTTATTQGSSAVTGTLDPTPCESTDDCADGYCVAPYDPATQPPIGDAVCVADCVEPGALDRACTDDASCCGELVCDPKALCVEADVGTTDTGDTGN